MSKESAAKYGKSTGSYSSFPMRVREETMELRCKWQNRFKLQHKRFQLSVRWMLSTGEVSTVIEGYL